jgi:hypothetical protein
MKSFNNENFVDCDEAANYLGNVDHVDELIEEPFYYFLKQKMLLPAEASIKTQDQFVFNGLIKMSKQDYKNTLYGQNLDQAPIEQFQLSDYGTANGVMNNYDNERYFQIKNNNMLGSAFTKHQYMKHNIYFKQTIVEKWAEDHGISGGDFTIVKPKQDDNTGGLRLAHKYQSKSLNIFYTILEECFFDGDESPIYERKDWMQKAEIEKKYKEQFKEDGWSQKLFDSIDRVITDGKRIGGKY